VHVQREAAKGAAAAGVDIVCAGVEVVAHREVAWVVHSSEKLHQGDVWMTGGRRTGGAAAGEGVSGGGGKQGGRQWGWGVREPDLLLLLLLLVVVVFLLLVVAHRHACRYGPHGTALEAEGMRVAAAAVMIKKV
jgi:hypothetical protein